MTKTELIEAMKGFPDDFNVYLNMNTLKHPNNEIRAAETENINDVRLYHTDCSSFIVLSVNQ